MRILAPLLLAALVGSSVAYQHLLRQGLNRFDFNNHFGRGFNLPQRQGSDDNSNNRMSGVGSGPQSGDDNSGRGRFNPNHGGNQQGSQNEELEKILNYLIGGRHGDQGGSQRVEGNTLGNPSGQTDHQPGGGGGSQNQGGDQRFGNDEIGNQQSSQDFGQQASGPGMQRTENRPQGGEANSPFRRRFGGLNRVGGGSRGGFPGQGSNQISGQTQGGTEGNLGSQSEQSPGRNPFGDSSASQDSQSGVTGDKPNGKESGQREPQRGDNQQQKGFQSDGNYRMDNQQSGGGLANAGERPSENEQRPNEGEGPQSQGEGKGFDFRDDLDERTLHRLRELAELFLKKRG